jgi:trehalose synthase
MPAKGSAEWKGDVPTGTGAFIAGDTISGGYSSPAPLRDSDVVATLNEITVQARLPEDLAEMIGEERAEGFDATMRVAREALAGRRVLNVNSSGTGGGVAEMLHGLVAYARGVGIDARWLVIEGNRAFFAVTKRIHNHLYGDRGDGGLLGTEERDVYEKTLQDNADSLLGLIRPRDLVILHDPQTLGLAAAARRAGAHAIWRCHVGIDKPNEETRRAWDFLRPYLDDVDACVFTRGSFAPTWLDRERVHVIAPSIDPFSAKNRDMPPAEVVRVLSHVGLLAPGDHPPPAPITRRDGLRDHVERCAGVLQSGVPPPAEVPLVVQIARWDRLKDMAGVMAGFAQHVNGTAGAHLVLAGPAVTDVVDDPEAQGVLEDCERVWRALPSSTRTRVHLAIIPMRDYDQNATIVNALERHAAIIVKKSLAEGFGLLVAEAMWKARPIVASAVGGIQDQIVDGKHALLVDDPTDLAAFGSATRRLLEDRELAERLGANARLRATQEFLPDRNLEQWAALLQRVARAPDRRAI